MNFIRIISLILLISLSAAAAPLPGFYYGKIKFNNGKSENIKIFVDNIEKNGLISSYGILIRNSLGAIFRIEELTEGTLTWLRLYQGDNYTLKVKSDFTPDFKSRYFNKDGKLFLKLIPLSNRDCNETEILVKKTSGQEWLPILSTPLTFADGNSLVELNDKNIILEALGDKNFHLTELIPSLAFLHEVVISPYTPSGWELKREIIGIIFMLNIENRNFLFWKKSKYEINLLELPISKNNCWFKLTNYKEI